jgi:hypothetical protein
MIFLHKNAANTFEYYDSLFIFKEYLSKSQNYIDLVYEYLPQLKDNVSKATNINFLTNIWEVDINEINKILDLDRLALLNISSQVNYK